MIPGVGSMSRFQLIHHLALNYFDKISRCIGLIAKYLLPSCIIQDY